MSDRPFELGASPLPPLRTTLLALCVSAAWLVPTQAQEPTVPGAERSEAAPSADPQPAAGYAAATLQSLSPLVADVQVVGPWVEGERTGIWRTITLQPEGEGAGNRFFVQQIEEVDGAPAVSSSTEITQVAELNGALIGYRADAPSEAQPELLSMFLDIVPLDGEIAETYELFFTAGEPYTFGPASN